MRILFQGKSVTVMLCPTIFCCVKFPYVKVYRSRETPSSRQIKRAQSLPKPCHSTLEPHILYSTMSQPKSSLSGLRTVKRNFSDAKLSDEPISWPRTQPNGSGREKRLRDIQAGIEQRGAAALLQSYTNITASPTGSQSQQPLPGTADEPPTKRRHLPPGWDSDTDAFMSSSSLTRTSSTKSLMSSVSRSFTVSTTLTSTPPSSKPKMVLSQEQMHILKLVEEGKGIFYTGSAGMWSFQYLLYAFICSFARHWKVGSSPGDHKESSEALCFITRCRGYHCLDWCVYTPHAYQGILFHLLLLQVSLRVISAESLSTPFQALALAKATSKISLEKCTKIGKQIHGGRGQKSSSLTKVQSLSLLFLSGLIIV